MESIESTLRESKAYQFDSSFYLRKVERIRLVSQKITTSEPTAKFILDGSISLKDEELNELYPVLESNLDKIFEVAKLFYTDILFFGEYELVTCDGDYGNWPTAWRIVSVCESEDGAFAKRCGNHNQAQVSRFRDFIPEHFIDKAWNVHTREQVDDRILDEYKVTSGTDGVFR